jgi:aminopeptidase
MNVHAPQAALRTHEERLDRLAEVAVKVGLGLRPGQELVMTAPVDALPLVRRITEHAYRAGAPLVTTLFSDDELTLLRYRHAPDSAFDHTHGWLLDGMAAAFRSGAARLAIRGDNPALLASEDPDKVSRANRAQSKAYRPALELITQYVINWTILSYATPAWAKAMFPDEPEAIAVARLWDAIFAAARVDEPDPVAAWNAHNQALAKRTAVLNGRSYAAIHFKGPAPTFASASRRGTNGSAARPRPRTASPATRTFPPKRYSPRPTRTVWTAPCAAPSRSPITAP